MRLALASVGLTSTLAQLLVMREVVSAFLGNELLFGLVLMIWLACVALGSWVLGRLAAQTSWGEKQMAIGLVIGGYLVPCEAALLRGNRQLLGLLPGAVPEFGSLIALLLVTLAPVCLLTGFLFALGAKLMLQEGQAAGLAYFSESLGAVFGGAIFSFAAVRWTDTFQTGLLVGAINVGVAGWLMGRRRARSLWYQIGLGSLLVGLGVGAIVMGRAFHERTLVQQWGDFVFADDSPYGRIIVQARDAQRVFFVNGMLAFESQSAFSEAVTHIPLLAHPSPTSVLLVGGGVAGDLREILKHPVDLVTYVELDPLLIEAAERYLPSEDAAVLRDERVAIVLTDGRAFVKRSRELMEGGRREGSGSLPGVGTVAGAPGGLYDVIILDLPEPSTGSLNRFYTREFFLEAKQIMSEGGLLSLGLPSAENYWSPELARRNASIFWTLRSVFSEVVLVPGEHDFYLASDGDLETDPEQLSQRLLALGIQTRWLTPSYLRHVFGADRFDQARLELESLQSVRTNQDMTPICYYYDLVLWLSRFHPGLRGVLEGLGGISLAWLLVPLVVLLALARRWRGLRLPLVVAAVGLVQMSLQIVILFMFQAMHGYLYAEVNVIVTGFMAGLATGSFLGARWVSRHDPGLSSAFRRSLAAVLVGLVILSALALLLGVIPAVIPSFVFPVLVVIVGGFGGAAFPLAVAIMAPEFGAAVVGSLYAADLLGGCLGALAPSLLLIPLLGMVQTCLVIALVGLAALLALVS